MIDKRLDQIIEGIEDIKETAESKQDALESGTNIKTVNNQSILGAGNLDVGSDITVDSELSSTSENPVQNKAIYDQFATVNDSIREGLAHKQNTLESGTNIKTVNNQSILGEGNLDVGNNITVDSEMSSSSENPVQNKVVKNYVDGEIQTVDGEIDTIESKIPAQAASNNKLADKDFVNSSISTATATFRGTFTSLSTLQSTEGDMNDYAFFSHTDSDGNTVYDRYKYVGQPETRVPDGYTELKSVNRNYNNGWVYINTGVEISPTDKIYAKIYVGDAGALYTAAYFGTTDSNNNYVYLHKDGSTGLQLRTSLGNSQTSTRITEATLIVENGEVYINDADFGAITIPTIAAGFPCYVFGRNNNGSQDAGGGATYGIYEFYIEDSNGNKKVDLIACKNSGNVNGMFDLVTNTFFTPVGGQLSATAYSTDNWLYEYSLNNSSFTAAQWAAINSGLVQNITSTGYDATATQVLKNVNGTIQWVTET